MNKTANRFVSMILALVMSFSCLPNTSYSVYAEEETGQQEEILETEESIPEEEILETEENTSVEEVIPEEAIISEEPVETTETEEVIEIQEENNEAQQEQIEGEIPEPVSEAAETIPDEPSVDIMATPVTDEIQSGNWIVLTTEKVTIAPDYSAKISWNTGFTPKKIKIVYYYSTQSAIGAWDTHYITAATLSGSEKSYILTYSKAESVQKQEPDYAAGIFKGWEVHAYYGSGDEDYSVGRLYVNLLPRTVNVTTADVSISPEGTGTIDWTANFRPVKSQIVYSYGEWGTVFEYNVEHVVAKTISGTAGICYLSYNEAETALKKVPDDSGIDRNGWYVKVYYGSGDEDYVLEKFELNLVKRELTLSNKSVSVLPDQAGQLSWSTNFKQKKVQIVYEYVEPDGWGLEFKDIVMKTYTGSSTGCLIYNSEVEQTLAKVPSSAYTDYRDWVLRVYYGSGSDDYVSASFTVIDSDYAFIGSPGDITIDPGKTKTLSWSLTFIPMKVEIYGQEGTRWVEIVKFTEKLSESNSYDLSYADAWPRMKIRAYYSQTEYIDSPVFSVTLVPYQFLMQPNSGYVEPESSFRVYWKTNFTAKKLDFGYVSGSEFITVFTDTNSYNHNLTIDTDINYDLAKPTMYIRAWYDDEHYIYSSPFTINIHPRQFTSVSKGTIVNPGETLNLQWQTNFKPSKVSIHYLTENGWVNLKNITYSLSTSMSHKLAYDEVHETMQIRAFYETDEYVTSSNIINEVNPRQFTVQPSGGTVYPWQQEPLTLSSEVNFNPVKYEIGYFNSRTGGWTLKKEITEDVSKSMSQAMSYDDLISGDMYIHAFYGTQDNQYIQSEAFSVVKLDKYECGDNLTATLDASSGILTFSGSGAMCNYTAENHAPWFDVRSYIKKAILPDGVTYIGTYAFHLCNKMHTLTFPPTVTAIGTNSVYDCTSLLWVNYDGFKNQWDRITWNYGNFRIQNASVSYLVRTGTLRNANINWGIYGNQNLLQLEGWGEIPRQQMPWSEFGNYIETVKFYGDIEKIGEENFRECTAIKTVYLPGSLTWVDDAAFNDCKSLRDVYFAGPISDWNNITIRPYNDPLTNASLHTEAVSHQLTDDLAWSVDDAGLLRIYVTDEFMGGGDQMAMPNYTSNTDAPWYADYADVITAVHVEQGVTSIGNNAFRGLANLRTLEISGTVVRIGNNAFSACRKLEDFTLPEGIVNIGSQAFSDCSYLEVLHLPESVTTLGSGAFAACSNLEKVWLPEKIVMIQDSVFLNDSLLDLVYIPSTVKYINQNVFSGCTALTDENSHVYFDGTSAQWKAITIYSGNDSLINAGNIHFNPEELKIDAVNFPDAQFRSYVSNNFDTDSSGWLTDAERSEAEYINDEDNDYTNLKGIEFFPNITSILIDAAPSLKSVDLSANKELAYVDFSSCGNLEEINLSGLSELRGLYLSGNKLSEVDLSGLWKLETLSISSNPLTEINLESLSLKQLYCANIPTLSGLDISDQKDLYKLYCYGSGIKELDLVYTPSLIETYTSGTRTSKTLDGIPYTEYRTDTNHILAIDPDCICYTENSGIRIDSVNFPDPDFRSYVFNYFDTNRSGWLSETEIAEATNITMEEDYDLNNVQGIEYLTELTYLLIDSNPNLTSIDLTANTKLTAIELWDNGLSQLNISGLTQLRDIYVDGNALTSLDVSEFNLINLHCYNNPLTQLTLGGQPDLKYLNCHGTELTELDITECPILIDLYKNGQKSEANGIITYAIESNKLIIDADLSLINKDGIPVDAEHFPDEVFRNWAAENVDISGNGYLSTAEIEAKTEITLEEYDDLTSLQGIEYLTEIDYLCIGISPLLTELDLSANTNLKTIDIYETGLTSLDVSMLGLTDLSITRSKLTDLALGEQHELWYLSCYGNDLNKLDISKCPKLVDTVQNGTKTEGTQSDFDYVEYMLGEYGADGYLRADKTTLILMKEPQLPTSISINPSITYVLIGETKQLNITYTPEDANDDIEWTTSDESIVKTDQNGKITAVSAGTAVIRASSTTNPEVYGECTVIVTETEVSIYGSSLALESKVGINIYLDIDEADVKDLDIHMTMNGNETIIPAEAGTKRVISKHTYMMYEYPVTAKEMRDIVTLTVTDKENHKVKLTKGEEDYTEGYPYSASEYFARVEEVGQEKTKKLSRVLNNYGKYAQIYFDYKVTNEVKDTVSVADVTAETLESYKAVMTEETVDGLTYAGGSTMLDDAIGFRIYFKVGSGYDIKKYTFTIDNKAVTPEKSGSMYFVELADIAAKDLGVMHTIKATDGTKTFGIQYSALSYARRVLELTGEDRVPLQNMCRAMYLYNQQAIEYFNTK